MASKLNTSQLHTKANSKHWHIIFTRILNGRNLSFGSAMTKSTWHNNPVCIFQQFGDIFRCDIIRIDPIQLDFCIIGITRVLESFYNRDIRIWQLHIFPNKRNFHLFLQVHDFINHSRPICHICFWHVQLQVITNDLVHVLCLQIQRNLIQMFHI